MYYSGITCTPLGMYKIALTEGKHSQDLDCSKNGAPDLKFIDLRNEHTLD